ncbi:hypothetical protein RFI_24647 [Reticulomyxa filosa]|uniref:Uncharacterized protein n=1 Tax=Reticulomyxa filosa TaxID=46433 RepID=X6MFP6_RETFI|nr:hypothetical protein RFI_24647 [Reticulomyxa filosa]|eukprot:ETO12729.1 hypothetical protein RFI_24647 [Reticulomyxa filosa]
MGNIWGSTDSSEEAEKYFKIVKTEQVQAVNDYTVQVNDVLICVKVASELASVFAYSDKYKIIHFGLIAKNNWYINEPGTSDEDTKTFPIMFAHVLPTKGRVQCGEEEITSSTHLRLHFYKSISQVENELLRITGGGKVYQSKYQANNSSMKKCIPLLEDILGKQYTFKPWEQGLSPYEFKQSDDMNCKRFVNKVEKHINYKVPDDVWEKAVQIISSAAEQDLQLANYIDQIEGRKEMSAKELSDHACAIL